MAQICRIASWRLSECTTRLFSTVRGKLHVTYSRCTWGEGCRQRMPMVRFGTILLDHCRWECTTSHPAVDVRREATVIIDTPSFGPGIQIPYRTAPDARCIVRK